MSPLAATEVPKASATRRSLATSFACGVQVVPLRVNTKAEPPSSGPTSSSVGCPATARSPAIATDSPKWRLGGGKIWEKSCVCCVHTVPLRTKMKIEPTSGLVMPPSSVGAPTTTLSPLMPTAWPNRSPARVSAPTNFCCSVQVDPLRVKTYAAPALEALTGAPTTRVLLSSATLVPNSSLEARSLETTFCCCDQAVPVRVKT